LVERPAVGQEDLGDGLAVAGDLAGPEGDDLAERQAGRLLPGPAAEVLAGLAAVDPVEPDLHRVPVPQYGGDVAVRDADDPAGEVGASGTGIGMSSESRRHRGRVDPIRA
jgi:hypothetical protein